MTRDNENRASPFITSLPLLLSCRLSCLSFPVSFSLSFSFSHSFSSYWGSDAAKLGNVPCCIASVGPKKLQLDSLSDVWLLLRLDRKRFAGSLSHCTLFAGPCTLCMCIIYEPYYVLTRYQMSAAVAKCYCCHPLSPALPLPHRYQYHCDLVISYVLYFLLCGW